MNQQFLFASAFLGGVFLAIQAGLNSSLGVLLKKPLLATIAASLSSAIFALLFISVFSKPVLNTSTVKQVPWYLWFSGGLFSVLGITLYYYTIPRLGISKMISLGLCGQVCFSVFAGHFGWLNLPLDPITFKKVLGVAAMITGIFLINAK